MTLRDFQECVEFNIMHNIKHAVLGLGAPGVGKSQVVRQIADKFGYTLIDLRLAQMSEVEIGGLIYPNEDRTKTRWLSPEVLPDEKRDGPNTILLLDEITSCPKRVQVAAYQLILDRRVGQYRLPEGTFVIGLGNREDDDGVYIHLAGPLADRFEIHYIDIDFNSWKYDFALPFRVHPYVVDYLSCKPAALHTQAADPESMVFATPRSWERVSDILKYDDDLNKPVVCNKIIGNVGMVEGSQFIAFCKEARKHVTADDYLEGKAEAPTDPSELTILINSLVEKVSFLQNIPTIKELSREQTIELQDIIHAMLGFGSSEATILGLRNLLEVNRTVVRDIFVVMNDPDVDEFLEKNKALMFVK